VDTVTGSSVSAAVDPPVVGPRFRRSITLVAALIVLLFVALVSGLLASRSRLDALSFPESSLALVVGRSMDIRFVIERQSGWERRLSDLLIDDRTNELSEAIVWYEEMAAHTRDPGVELQLAVLEGEAGRRERLREKLDGWEVRPDPYPAMASAVSAAYLDGVLGDPEDTAVDLPVDGYPWFGEQLALRLAMRRGDQAQVATILDERRDRTAPLRRRVRALAALEIGLLGAAAVAAATLLLRRPPPLGRAPIPPPWSGWLGAVVLVRGAALQVLLLGGLYVISHLAESAVLDALTWPWSNLFFLPMLLLARHHLMRPAGLGLRDGVGLSLVPGSGWRLFVVVIALLGIGLAGDWAASTFAARRGKSSHWTEWFDEDLVWGGGADAALAILSAAVAAPFFEEVIFRGLLFATFRRHFGLVVSAFASALIFAAAHGYGWVGLLSVLWSGVLWAWSYERTRSLVPGMLAHAAVNLLATLGVLLLLR
jgi:membrane protease YdiL (CAAX protease family)